MSLKAIELQIALPKTFEAGKVAEQKQQQAQLHHDLGHEAALREAERNKRRTLEAARAAKLRKEDEEQKQKERDEAEKRKKKGKENDDEHPYKGSFVDFSG